ncbi:unnamed protein product [Toxocara canis]|uniref:RRM_8 domain-containing protein n=1 Tax=Toxocara canis TaxID=6265 RepID=A0A183U9J3_TOXCA|nr:unnamed protein product [Toxocara canis]
MIRRSMLQALVEFENAGVAKKAKHAMNGADIYSGCCTLKVEFAKAKTSSTVEACYNLMNFSSTLIAFVLFKLARNYFK